MSSLLIRSCLPRVIPRVARTALVTRPLITISTTRGFSSTSIMSEATNVYTKEAPFREPLTPLLLTLEANFLRQLWAPTYDHTPKAWESPI